MIEQLLRSNDLQRVCADVFSGIVMCMYMFREIVRGGFRKGHQEGLLRLNVTFSRKMSEEVSERVLREGSLRLSVCQEFQRGVQGRSGKSDLQGG